MFRSFRFFPVLAMLCANVFALAQAPDYARDPHQAIDESYTAAIRKYTTAPEFKQVESDVQAKLKKLIDKAAGADNGKAVAEVR